jgi:ABC-type phosphate transport system substrate-binding protein
MMKLPSPRLLRAAVGLAALGALAVAPVAAQAANTDANGTLTAGGLTNTAPAITPFALTLNGSTQTVTTAVGAWAVSRTRPAATPDTA